MDAELEFFSMNKILEYYYQSLKINQKYYS